MSLTDMQVIGGELALKWDDGGESFISLERFRRGCPCAECQGERDIMGNLHKGAVKPLTGPSFQLRNLQSVGTYAVQPAWGDGHTAGIYPFEYLRKLGEQS